MAQDFSLTPSAVKRVGQLLAQEAAGSYLRITVEGGGCSGFQYKFLFTQEPLAEDDLVLSEAAARVALDAMSLELVKGSALDFVEELGASYFAIKNPNATATCGCGNSFAL
jgi:iron-sulfur cluster assembly accessory protein